MRRDSPLIFPAGAFLLVRPKASRRSSNDTVFTEPKRSATESTTLSSPRSLIGTVRCACNISGCASTQRSSGVTSLTLWKNPNSIRNLLVDLVARVPASVQTKLLFAFLTLVGLLIILGAVGLAVLSGVNDQTNELIKLQRKIAAYRQVQHDTTNQLYGIATALQFPEDRILDAALRQLNQFGYDFDRLEYVARDEADLLGKLRKEYRRFIDVETQVVGLIRNGQVSKAREMQVAEGAPLADRLERLTNQQIGRASCRERE